MWAEANLDSVQFTVNTDELFARTLDVVAKIEERTSMYLSADCSGR